MSAVEQLRTIIADYGKELFVLLEEVEEIEKKLDKLKKSLNIEYEKLDEALDKNGRSNTRN